MNSITRPAFELALSTTIDALKAIKADGADLPTTLGTLRAKMFDEAFLEKQHRQTFLKRINETLDTGFTMNQVRKGDPTLLAAATEVHFSALEEPMIAVDELHGTTTLNTVHAAGHAEALIVNNVKDHEWVAVNEAPQTNEQTSKPSSEQDTMHTLKGVFDQKAVDQANAATAATATTTQGNTMKAEQTVSKFDQFIGVLAAAGHTTDVARDALYNAFLAGHLNLQPLAQAAAASSKASNAGLSNDAQFFDFISKVPAAESAFALFLTTYKPQVVEVVKEERSRFSFNGPRDEGIRSGWVAAGAAVLGAVLETGHRGSLSVGSGIGAVAGVVGSYFAAEMLDEHIDNQFGRYVAAGTLGLALGSIGSGLGRMGGDAVLGSAAQQSEGGSLALPAGGAPVSIQAPSAAYTSAMAACGF